MEQRIGYDFSRVRVHSGRTAQRSARDLNANAYAIGPNVVFGKDQFAPDTRGGRRLIAHELTHVIQQSAADRLAHRHDSRGTASVHPGVADGGGIRVAGRSDVRIARNGGPPIPTVLGFLTSADLAKLKAFGDADYQSSLGTLEGHLRKTKGFTAQGDTQKYIDIRQAAGELRTLRDYLSDPQVSAVKVVPSDWGGRSPDMYIRYSNGDLRRVEISNITLASPEHRPEARAGPGGAVSPRIPRSALPDDPNKTVVDLPVNEFKETAIKAAIRSKIKLSSKGPSQLDAQNPNTRAGGAPMATGGDVVVQVTHGEVNRARLDQVIKELQPELVASSARRVQIDSVDAADARAGRKIFEYSREGQEFVGIVRKPNRLPALELTPAQRSGLGRPGMGTAGVLRGVGGAIFALIVHFALAAILNIVRQVIEEAEVDRALKKIEPQIAARLSALAPEVQERQSKSEQPVIATIRYSLNYLHILEARSQGQLFFGDSPSDIETNKMFQDTRRAEQDMTILDNATLLGVTLSSEDLPADGSSFSKNEHPSGTYETLVFSFQKSIRLERFSDVELRDYVLQQALAEEMTAPEGASPSLRASELRTRLDRLQGSIARTEETKHAEIERERQADAQRKQLKLAQARNARTAPAPPGPALLPEPGVPAPRAVSTPQTDPFNLGGRPRQKTPFEQAVDAADIEDALRAEFVAKADALKRHSGTGELEKHRAEVTEWIVSLRAVLQAWKAKGSSEWPSVKRLQYLVWWVDEPQGRAALMR